MSSLSTRVDRSRGSRPAQAGLRPGDEIGLRVPPDWVVLETDTFAGRYTRIVYLLPDGSQRVWTSRRHRLGCAPHRPARALLDAGHRVSPVSALWLPTRLSWWMAVGYIVGCLIFITMQALQLAGVLSRPGVEWGYLAASVAFAVANYCGLVSALNADDDLTDRRSPTGRYQWFGWRPDRIGYLISFVLVCGSSMFVLEALCRALLRPHWSASSWLAAALGVVGSVAFLMATAAEVREVREGSLWWEPHNLGWWRAALSFLGCVGFVVGSAAAFASSWLPPVVGNAGSEVLFLVGIGLFLLGAYLILPELAQE